MYPSSWSAIVSSGLREFDAVGIEMQRPMPACAGGSTGASDADSPFCLVMVTNTLISTVVRGE